MSMTICDRADEFRIEINGHFAGKGVNDVRSVWEEALLENAPRRFTVDITQLGGYDYAGCQLLRDMYRHGTRIAARTALSLAFLKEILRSSNSGNSSRFQAAAGNAQWDGKGGQLSSTRASRSYPQFSNNNRDGIDRSAERH